MLVISIIGCVWLGLIYFSNTPRTWVQLNKLEKWLDK